MDQSTAYGWALESLNSIVDDISGEKFDIVLSQVIWAILQGYHTGKIEQEESDGGQP